MSDLKEIIHNSFADYSGAVLQSRALADSRDLLKPSARLIFYSMYKNKLTDKRPIQKTNNAIGLSMVDGYIHGDSSLLGILMRHSQSFALRYPLVKVEGNNGTLLHSGSWAAARYTSTSLSKLGTRIFESIDKETIEEWHDNFDKTGQYPSVVPSKGFPNVCNGTMGIGVALSTSVPQFNLNEVVKALEVLIKKPDASFEEIYCCPDFATGALLYNEEEVKKILKKGYGGSCKLRSVVEWNTKDRCFVVSEIPYSVYTETICAQLEDMLDKESENYYPEIERFNDFSSSKPFIKIYLTKNANPDKVLRHLYKKTSLQYYYSINMNLLEDGRFPKAFTWKDILQAHVDHQIKVYTREFEFDLRKIKARLHVLKGLIIARENIDEVIRIIKGSISPKKAKESLMTKFKLTLDQVDAILKMRLSQLTKLEVEKLEKEKIQLEKDAIKIETILANKDLLDKEIIKGWEDVAHEFGDERRTKVIELPNDDEDEIEIKNIVLSITNKNNYFANEVSSVYAQGRKGVGSRMKLESDEYIIETVTGKSSNKLLLFTKTGDYISIPFNTLNLGSKEFIGIHEPIVATLPLNKKTEKQYLIFTTKNGYIKKSKLDLYNTNRQTSIKALSLGSNDQIVNVELFNNELIGLLSSSGHMVITETKNINPIGRASRGVQGIKLDSGATLVAAHKILPTTKELITINKNGIGKRTNIKEYRILGRNTKGVKAQKSTEVISFYPITTNKDILITSNETQIRLKLKDVPSVDRVRRGVQLIKLKNGQSITSIAQL